MGAVAAELDAAGQQKILADTVTMIQMIICGAQMMKFKVPLKQKDFIRFSSNISNINHKDMFDLNIINFTFKRQYLIIRLYIFFNRV